jgi:hypothetical protein
MSKNMKDKDSDTPSAGFVFNDSSVSIFIGDHNETIALKDDSQIPNIVENLLESASIATGIMPKQVVAAVSGYWSQGAMVVVRFNRHESEKPITDKEFTKIKKELSKIALSESEASACRAYGTDTVDLGLTNSQIAFVKVDDFLSTDPVGLKGKAVEIAFCNMFAISAVLERIEKAFRKKKIDLLTITDATAVQLSFLPEKIEEAEDFVSLLEAGNTYDLVIVFGKKIIATRTLPLSREFAGANPDWFMKGMRDALSSFDGIKAFPETIVVFGKSLGIEDQIANYPWSRSLPFQAAPRIINIERGIGEVFPKVVRALA